VARRRRNRRELEAHPLSMLRGSEGSQDLRWADTPSLRSQRRPRSKTSRSTIRTLDSVPPRKHSAHLEESHGTNHHAD
jgi:hypothetical protein